MRVTVKEEVKRKQMCNVVIKPAVYGTSCDNPSCDVIKEKGDTSVGMGKMTITFNKSAPSGTNFSCWDVCSVSCAQHLLEEENWKNTPNAKGFRRGAHPWRVYVELKMGGY